MPSVYAIASDGRENRISSPSPSDTELGSEDELSETEATSDSSHLATQPTSEILELFLSIPETITSLFRLSILIRNSSSRDRYAKAETAASKLPFNDQFDIDHVGNKFPRLYLDDRAWLRTRLGRAITQRRQYLRYCREHHEKLSKSDELQHGARRSQEPEYSSVLLAVEGHQPQLVSHTDNQTTISRPTSTLAPTTASTIIVDRMNELGDLNKLDQNIDDDTRSQTSYAASVADDDSNSRLAVVRLEDIAKPGQPFECPYCWTIQQPKSQDAWRYVNAFV